VKSENTTLNFIWCQFPHRDQIQWRVCFTCRESRV